VLLRQARLREPLQERDGLGVKRDVELFARLHFRAVDSQLRHVVHEVFPSKSDDVSQAASRSQREERGRVQVLGRFRFLRPWLLAGATTVGGGGPPRHELLSAGDE